VPLRASLGRLGRGAPETYLLITRLTSWDLDTYQDWFATTYARLAGSRTGIRDLRLPPTWGLTCDYDAKTFAGNASAPNSVWHKSQIVILLRSFCDTRGKPDD
jgi:hypothetical protein